MSKKTRILLVDDDTDILFATTRVLKSAGYDVREASSVKECMLELRVKRTDLLLLCISLPDEDGRRFCSQIKADPDLQGIFVVLLSSIKTSSNDQVEGLDLGADGYINRPVSNNALLARVQDMDRIRVAEYALQKAHDELEQRVQERTAELVMENDKLKAGKEKYCNLVEHANQAIIGSQNEKAKLNESIERFNAYLENSTEAIWCVDLREPIDISLPVEEQLDLVYQHAYISEANDAYARIAGLESREELIGLSVAEFAPRDNPANVAQITELIRKQYSIIGLESHEKFPNNEERILLNNVVGIIENGKMYRSWGTALDITELRKAEEEIITAEERYRTIADFTYDWEYWQGSDGQLLYVSPSCERITGYSPHEFISQPKLIDDIIIMEDSPGWQLSDGCIEPKTSRNLESIIFRIRRKDGDSRWIEHVCQPVYDSNGASLGIRVSNRDITKRYEAELALKESEANLRAYMDNTEDLICARDFDGSLVFWNEAFNQSCIRNFGVPARVGLKTKDFIPEDQSSNFDDIVNRWRKVFQGHIVTADYSFTRSDGEKRILSTKWTPIKIENQVQWAAEITKDITKRKLAEQNLKRSEKHLRLMADSLPVFISYVGAEEHYLFANKAYLDFFDLGIDQIVGKHVKEVVGTGLYKHIRRYIKKVLGGEQVSFETEIDKNGINHLLESIYIPDKDEKGMTTGYFVLATDVTKRMKRELQLQRHREELAHVSRLTTMGELTASLAHELNQPLTAILSNAQAARRFLEVDPIDLEEVKDILDDIINDDRRAVQVIKRLRSFLKRGQFYLKKWDINEVVQEVVTLVHSDAVIRNVSVHLDLQEELPHVLGDRIQIQQVLLNLIINGLDAMKDLPPESRSLIIKTEYEQVKNVITSVGDSGTGIEPDQMQLIFEPFHTTKTDGMGMGLSINRSIIQAHHGELWAENNPNQGATFFFSLPAASGDNIDG